MGTSPSGARQDVPIIVKHFCEVIAPTWGNVGATLVVALFPANAVRKAGDHKGRPYNRQYWGEGSDWFLTGICHILRCLAYQKSSPMHLVSESSSCSSANRPDAC